MKETFVLNGKWWTPTSPEQAILGEITFDPSKGAILVLDGLLREDDTCTIPFEIVLGETDDGTPVTLVGSSDVWLAHPYRIADDGLPDVHICSSLCAKVLIIGGHFHSLNELGFKSFIVDLPHLTDWADHDEIGNSERSRITATYSFEVGRSGILVIENDDGGPYHMSILPDSEVSLDTGIEMIRQLRNLMSLFVHRPVPEARVRGLAAGDIGAWAMVDILYPSFARDRNVSPLRPEDMLLPLDKIVPVLGEIISRWFIVNERMARVLDLYFAASQGGELFPETRFLMYMQAIEAYHRLRYRNFEVDPEVHNERLGIILSSIPERYLEWMQEGLRYSNEPSIGQRLKDIYHDLRDVMDEFVNERKLFIFRIVKTRNHLTHLEGDGDDAIFMNNDLLLATMRLRLMLELCLLKEIGIEREMMKEAVMKNAMFSPLIVRSSGPNI